jgi:adenylate kinase
MNIVLLGPPGAGKGSLAKQLHESMGFEHISTGDMLREEMTRKTPLGDEIKKIMAEGNLVPDEIVIRLIEKKLTEGKHGTKGYLLDGFPRTKAQAEELDRFLSKSNQSIDSVVNMQSTLDIVLVRLTGRRVCRNCGALYHVKTKPSTNPGICDECGGELYQRPDDNEETIRTRMSVYLEKTKPIIEYYRKQNKLKNVDGDKKTDEVAQEVSTILNEDGKFN